jgi:hemerythrin-like domain-containing protein
MKTVAHDAHLTDALAAVIGYLRMGAYDGLRRALDQALHSSADEFIGLLAEHLRQEEEALFPALRDAARGAAALLAPLQEQHASLRVFASELAQRLAVDDRQGACEVARSFLAALLEHVEREDRAVEELIRGLPPAATDRLLRRVGLHRREEED